MKSEVNRTLAVKKTFNLFNGRSAKAQAGGCAKLFCLVLTMLLTLGVGEMTAADETYGNSKRIYLDLSNCTAGWTGDNACIKIKMYYWDSDNELIGEYSTTQVGSEKVYYATTNNAWVRYVQAIRKSSDCNTQWNYSNRVAASSRTNNSQNCIRKPSGNANWWDTWVPEWTTYCPQKATSVISDNRTTTYGGNGSSSTPYKVEKGGTIKVSASSTNVLDDGNMTTKYAFYVGSSKNQDGTGTTYSYTASSTAGTTHQLKVNSYNNYNSTSSADKYSDILYYTTVTCYSVTYNGNSPTSGSAPANTKHESGTDVILATNTGSLEKTGYTLTGWNTNTTGTGAHYDLGATVDAIGANLVLYAEWTAGPALVVAAGEGISSVTGATSPVTLGTKYDISATVATGYMFNTWSASPAANATFDAAGSATTKVTVKNGSVTVTASGTERMSSLSTSCHYDAGNPSYSNPTVSNSATNVGYVTTRTITAPAAGTGYNFVGWTLTNCTRTDGGEATDNPITIRSNGDGAAATVVANYEEDLTTNWYINGDASGSLAGSPFAGWGTSGTNMSKKTGHSTEEIYYCNITVSTVASTDAHFPCKVYNDNNGHYYSSDDEGNYWITKENNSVTVYENTGNNMKFRPYLTGTYEFKVDNTGSNPVLTVTWPVFNQVRISAASPSDATNVGNFDLSSPVSNVRSVTRSLAANTTYTFKIMYDSEWYGFDSGTFTRSTSTSSNSRTLSTSGGDMTITTDIAGDYTFKFNQSSKLLSIDYPEAYKITFDRVPTAGGKTAPWANTTGDVGDKTITSGVTYIAAGTTVYVYAAAAKDYYTYYGIYSVNNPTKGDYTYRLSSTYSYSTTLNSDLNFYAVYFEKDYWVGTTGSHGSVDPTGQNCHVATEATFTANPDHGWKFYNWTIPANVTAKSGYTASSNPLIVNATAAATLTANFQPRWGLFGANLPGNSSWSDDNYQIEDNFYESPASSGKYEGQEDFTLAANTIYQLKVKDRTVGDMYGFASGAADVNIYYSESGTYSTLTNASGNGNVYLHSAAQGTYTFKWNEDTKKLAVVYPESWYITSGQNDADGGSFTAIDNSSNNVKGGKFVANNATVTFTATPATGYNFGGWYSNEGCTTAYVDNDDDINISGATNNVLALSSITADKDAYAKFTAKTYTVTLTRSGTGYGSGGSGSVTATYNQTLPAATLPTAANGYAFMGYYTAADGKGTQFMDASGNWATSVTDTISDSKWVLDADATLYAYYKQAEITELTLDNAVVAPSTTITVTPTITPTPTGTVAVCYELQYSNGTPLPSQPTFTPGVGNAVSFTAPAASATYKIQAILHLDDCDGTAIDTEVASFQVAGEHTVTVQYKCDDITIKASTEMTARPLEWTDNFSAPTITGYTFQKWVQGDGVTIDGADGNGEKTTSTIRIKATYDGTLTAVYTKKRMIYFYNTLGWESVYVYFYKNDSYWQTVSPYNGSGANTTFTWTSTPYSEGKHGQMQPVSEGSNIYYFDAEAAGVNASYDDVVFTEHDQHGYDYFHETNAVRRGDYKSSIPMFVPLADQEEDVHNQTNYYNDGYWMNYPENSGYTLKIYNAWNATKETAAVRSIEFPYSADLKMPLKLDVEFNEANHEYWFMVYRNDGTYLGSDYNFKQGYQDEQTITGGNDKNKITTSAPGTYKLTLTYHDNGSGTVNYYIDVDFPIATGDYRIYYSDNATWSQGAHTKDSWNHPSHSIAKIDGEATEAKKDTISFYIPKGDGISHTMKFQKASVTNEGVVSWSDVASGSITIPSSVTTSGVYNFIVSQPAGGSSISLEKVEPYTGNYYIRTDCAGNTKWDSFKNVDHQMTYSDYAENNSGYSHYYAHWVESGNNVSFTIANDYSMCISDTLFEDYGTTIADISNVGALNSGNASIRFMWNQATNKISRAYISGSSNIADRFLVLEGDAKMFDENGDALSVSGLDPNEINLVDDQNFVYERIIQLKTTARGRLSAMYNDNTQYFIGSSGDFAEGTTVELLGGTASDTKYSMRIVYDFKTNRLVRAYIPSGSDITENLAINADIMLVREHQEAGQQLTFDGGSLSKVQTVYGVMRFNRWTLNNKETTGGHSVVDDPKSIYERSLYWISFPFDVNLSDVFGFGTYNTDWIVLEYDGAERAAKGYWADSQGFWKYITNRRGVVLKAGKGYVLNLDLDRMKDNNTSFWANNIEQVELFFPSAEEVKNIEATNTEITVDSHECTITPRPGQTDDRTKKDSHWNIIGVPSYANYGSTLKDGNGNTINWNDNPETKDLPFLYEWNTTDNTYTVRSGTTYPFKAMHAYMVQYYGKLKWTLASATPVSAPARVPSAAQDIEFRMELQQNSLAVDQTFLRMTNDEEISADFDFNYDLSKQMNSGKANIYTMVEGYIQTAGNCLPMNEQTTVVPVGVKITTNDYYTFSIPEGTEGVGVTLIDTETGIRTCLSAVDYTVSLEAGTYNNRFVLEISPIQHIATDAENAGNDAAIDGVRKLLIDGLLYIVRDGKVYDARGARIE